MYNFPEDDDFIIPPYLFRIRNGDEDFDSDSDSDSVTSQPRCITISTVSMNFLFDSINTDWLSNDINSNHGLNVANTNTSYTLEDLISMRREYEEDRITSEYIELRNNMINRELNEGNISLYQSRVINYNGNDANLNEENPTLNFADSYFDMGGVRVQWNTAELLRRMPVPSQVQRRQPNTPWRRNAHRYGRGESSDTEEPPIPIGMRIGREHHASGDGPRNTPN